MDSTNIADDELKFDTLLKWMFEIGASVGIISVFYKSIISEICLWPYSGIYIHFLSNVLLYYLVQPLLNVCLLYACHTKVWDITNRCNISPLPKIGHLLLAKNSRRCIVFFNRFSNGHNCPFFVRQRTHQRSVRCRVRLCNRGLSNWSEKRRYWNGLDVCTDQRHVFALRWWTAGRPTFFQKPVLLTSRDATSGSSDVVRTSKKLRVQVFGSSWGKAHRHSDAHYLGMTTLREFLVDIFAWFYPDSL